ncbi:hypothetical protein [Streptomyces agglomeratus]|uniref:hypothetical protein n=1 Tax=Streptomyces agglomeratus TaxID=285458 RepID=UPI00114D109A|nr:hypothetical protein [Streptomyces agglomeratus]
MGVVVTAAAALAVGYLLGRLPRPNCQHPAPAITALNSDNTSHAVPTGNKPTRINAKNVSTKSASMTTAKSPTTTH